MLTLLDYLGVSRIRNESSSLPRESRNLPDIKASLNLFSTVGQKCVSQNGRRFFGLDSFQNKRKLNLSW